MASTTIPEILRINLSSIVLQLLTIGIKRVKEFDFVDKPNPDVRQIIRCKTLCSNIDCLVLRTRY